MIRPRSRPSTVITPEIIAAIRERSGVMSAQMIAVELGLTQSTVSKHQRKHDMPRLTPVQGRAANAEYFS